jgi:hypothetical protein
MHSYIALITFVAATAMAPMALAQTPVPDPAVAAARKVIADGNKEWGRARVAMDKATFDRMLSPDFYCQLPGQKVSRKDFVDMISQSRPNVKLTRFDASVLTVEQEGDHWVATIQEKLEVERNKDGKTEKAYSLWITKDTWKQTGDKWQILSSEALGSENWWGGAKPPMPDWSTSV